MSSLGGPPCGGKPAADWTPPAGDWLARNVGSGKYELLSCSVDTYQPVVASKSQPLPLFLDEKAALSDKAASTIGLHDADNAGGSRSGSRRYVAADPISPDTPPQAAPAPAPSQPARPLLLARSPLPAAGAGAAACRRPPAALCPRSRAPPAALVAGAIASGRPLPKVPSQVGAIGAQVPGTSEKDSVSVMAARLSQVERLNQTQAAKLAKQAQELDSLRAELSILRKIADVAERQLSSEGFLGVETVSALQAADRRHTDEEFEVVQAERDHFQRQVEEMTKFLKDYGLIWVGDSQSDIGEGFLAESDSHPDVGEGAAAMPDPQSPEHGHSTTASAKSSTRSPRHVADDVVKDVPSIIFRVKALNDMVESKGSRIVSDVVGGAVHARLVADDPMPLPLTLFSDGLKLGTLPFCEYESRDAQLLLRDIYDGFFPYVLKDAFPDGVQMRVVDRSTYGHCVWLDKLAETDSELASDGSRLLPSVGRVLHGPKESQQQRTRVGAVAVRHGPRAPAAPLAGPADEMCLLAPNRPSEKPVARIQVRLESGSRIILSMEPESTIRSLRDALISWHERQGGTSSDSDSCSYSTNFKAFTFRSAFPSKTLDVLDQTLKEAGLCPSATLFLSPESVA